MSGPCSLAAGCPPWCQSKHKGTLPVHMRQYPIDSRCWVTALRVDPAGNGEPHDEVQVVQAGPEVRTAALTPDAAMQLALILQARTGAAEVHVLASAMHRAGELLAGQPVEGGR